MWIDDVYEAIKCRPWWTLVVTSGTITTGYVLGQWLYRPRNSPPGPIGLPIIGSILNLSECFHEDLDRIAKKFGDVYTLKLVGSNRLIILNSYEAIKEAFVTQGASYASRPDSIVQSLFNEEIFSRKYSEELVTNKKFALQALRSSGFGTQLGVDKILSELDVMCDWIKSEKGEPFDLYDHSTSLLGNIISSILFNRSYKKDDVHLKNIINASRAMLDNFTIVVALGDTLPECLLKLIAGRSLKCIENTIAVIEKHIKEIIDEDRQTFDPNNLRHFLDHYIKDRSNLDEETLAGTILIFLPDSIDTMSHLLQWCLLFILSYPDVKNKIVEEVDKLLGSRPVKLSDKSSFVFFEATYREILRCSLPFTISPFHMTTKETTLKGFTIPKGSAVMANLYSSHFDAKIFPDPHKFDPMRHFESDGKTLINSSAIMPFSVGRRACLGEQLVKVEIFVLMTTLLQRFEIDFDPNSPPPDTKPVKDEAARHPKPFKIVVKER